MKEPWEQVWFWLYVIAFILLIIAIVLLVRRLWWWALGFFIASLLFFLFGYFKYQEHNTYIFNVEARVADSQRKIYLQRLIEYRGFSEAQATQVVYQSSPVQVAAAIGQDIPQIYVAKNYTI